MKPLNKSLLALVLASLAGCGQQLVEFPNQPVAPTVVSTDPANASTAVGVSRTVNATFSELMNPTTISVTTFTLNQGATPVSGTVTYVGMTATFHPTADLAGNTTYTATITTGAKSLASGTSLASAYSWSFTTAAVGVVPPAVLSVDPGNSSTGVPTNKHLVATFSTAMNQATLTATTFTLTQGTSTIAGTVTSTATTATFAPTAALLTSTTYVATITTGAKDVAGVGIVANYTWSFSTAAAPAPPAVVSVDPGNNSIGVATNKQLVATFSRAMNQATLTTTTFTLTQGTSTIAGTVTSTATTATFTPSSTLATNTTYVATITTGAQDPAGIALAANYSWTFVTALAPSAPTISSTLPGNGSTGVPTSAQVSATFSRAMATSTLASPATVFTLHVGSAAGASVTGTVAYAGTTATFTPSAALATNTVYFATITTGAQDPAGIALAASFTWSFTTAAPPAAPTITIVDPGNSSTGVLTTKHLSATFSRAMSTSTLASPATTFTLKTFIGNVSVTGTVTYSGLIATFTPTSLLAANTSYVATITTGAQDPVGIWLAADYTWTFTTAGPPAAPQITSVLPANGTIGVPPGTQVSATFSRAMSTSTLASPATTFTLKTFIGNVSVTGTVTYSGTTATFTPASLLATSTSYVATITTAAQDVAGIAIVADYSWSFTIGLVPTLILTNPANSATSVPINQVITATFSEFMDPATLASPTGTSFTLYVGSATGTSVTGTVTYVGITAVFTPSALLSASTTYTSMVSSTAKDLNGTALASGSIPNPWSWTTGPAGDTSTPVIILTEPASSSTNVSVNSLVKATFNKAMDGSTMIAANFALIETASGTSVTGTVAYDVQNRIATFMPQSPLAFDTEYTMTVSSSVMDVAKNKLVVPAASTTTPNPWTFMTAGPVPPLAIDLGTAATFGIASQAGLTNTGVSVVNGNVALYITPSCTDSTGNFGASQTCLVKKYVCNGGTGMTVNGSVYWAGDPYDSGETAHAVTTDLNVAWVAGLAMSNTAGTVAGDQMAGKIFTPGVYTNANLGLQAGGLAQLDAQNDANAIFVFQVTGGGDFTDSGTLLLPSEVRLVNGAQARNVWFVVGRDITIGHGTTWNGNILAGRTVTVNDGSRVLGRVLAGATGAGAFTIVGAASPSLTTITVPQ
jgi:hypothetical protein